MWQLGALESPWVGGCWPGWHLSKRFVVFLLPLVFFSVTFWTPHPPRDEGREAQRGPVGEARQCPHQEHLDLNLGSWLCDLERVT